MKTIEPQAVDTAAEHLEAYRKGGGIPLPEAIRRLAPTIGGLLRQGTSYATISGILNKNGVAIKPTTLRVYYHRAIHAQSEE